ncbi:type I secretion system ATPase [Thiothrix nivea DSM 5205]|uniref:Type I secretion system ATPase n=2 Tax=Thiothrix nivea TaxID=1031 RepID=A0A656HAY9_THINJ|nr:type I secretion system ATPase [Thiothrix nivea DSM 5205]
MGIQQDRMGKKQGDLARLLGGLKSSFMYVGFFSLFVNVLMLVPSLYMLQVYDRVMASRSGETLLMLTLIVAWLFFTMGVLELVRSRLLVRIGTKLDDALSSRLYSAIMTMAIKFPGKGSVQPLSDLTSIRQFLTGNAPFAFFDTPWIPIYIGVLFLFHPWFGWFSMFAASLLIVIAIANNLVTRDRMKAANNQYTKANAVASAHVRNAEVIHAMGMEASLRESWLKQHLSFLREQSLASDQSGLWSNLSKVVRMLFQSLILGVGAYLAIHNEITSGMLIAGSILMGRALAPIDQMISTWKQFGSARQAYERLDGMLAALPATDERLSLPAPQGSLQCENLSVLAPGTQNAVLRAVTFQVPAGETLVVLGPSAAGKSSLARALVGVWPAVAGKIRIDNADINHWNREELGPYLGYLPQDVELFEGTVAENIARFGRVEPEKVHLAAQMAGVDSLVRRLPEGYDTPIGVGGVALSGGQRQRIGLARALYGSPKIVVLDEPNASLDEAGEAALLRACQLLKEQGTTLVLVTHRPGVVGIADKLLVLADGQVGMFGERDFVLKSLAQRKAAMNKSIADFSSHKSSAA